LNDPKYATFPDEVPFCLLAETVTPGFDYSYLDGNKDDAIRTYVEEKLF
jgi:hypothetical protein